jgi:hypothetical protein
VKWLRAIVLILALAATVAGVLYRRENPATQRLQPTLESLGVGILWAVLLAGLGGWKRRPEPDDLVVTYFNEAWNPDAVDRAGLFLGWLVDRELLSSEWADDPNADLFRRREITGRELLEDCGDKIVSEMLDDTGNSFTLDYFASSDEYWDDCEESLASGAGGRSDPWADFAAVKDRVDRRFAAWNARRLESTIDGRARRILFTAYWDSSGWKVPRDEPNPQDAAYATEVGYLFDEETVRHDTAIKRARRAVEGCSLDLLLDAFVASLSHRWLHLRAGLPAFYIASRMPPHSFDSAGTCPSCGLFDSNSIDFGAANFARHKWGAFPTTFAPEHGFILERVSKELGWVGPPVTDDDRRILRQLLTAAATQKPEARAADLVKAWQSLLPSNAQERNLLLESFIAIGVLAPSRTGPEDRRRIPPRSNWSDEAALWRGDDGVDEARVEEVFGKHLLPSA